MTRFFFEFGRLTVPASTLVAIILTGCSSGGPPEPAPTEAVLKGKIFLNNNMIKIGSVRAYSPNGIVAEGTVLHTGYHIQNVPLGEVTLVYVMPKETKETGGKMMHYKNMPGKEKKDPDFKEPGRQGPVKLPEREEKMAKLLKALEGLPSRYLNPAESGLTTTISPGMNEYAIKMTTP